MASKNPSDTTLLQMDGTDPAILAMANLTHEEVPVTGEPGDADGPDPGLQKPQSTKPSQKKRIQYARFATWLEQHQEKVAQAVQIRGDSVEDRPVTWMIRDFEGHKIIESPRDYQIELFERAKEKNTIAVLDTGSGKTLIAALLLRHVVEQELEDRASGKAKRVAFFLVDKVALVFQQYAVLECNLGYNMEKFCGESMRNLWSKDFWADQFARNMVIVCTADILYQCLHHAFIQMEQINLLIFDEAHHAKKNHTYARIMKDFYLQTENKDWRPRIFGMTASPVDGTKEDLQVAMAKLESILDSQIATVRDPAVLQRTVCRPKEERVALYEPLSKEYETPLVMELKLLLGTNSHFIKPLKYAKEIFSRLGPWFADRFCQLLLTEEGILKFQAKIDTDHSRMLVSEEARDHYVDSVKAAGNLLRQWSFDPATNDCSLVSSKVRTLLSILSTSFSRSIRPPRCIVFVQERSTAELLADYLEQPGVKIPNLHAGVLTGVAPTDFGSRASIRNQVLTIFKFKRGDLNCLFATSIAEEGLDIPNCNLIIRFDLYHSVIQYIQSRGRARHQNSIYVHMLEVNNLVHRRIISASAAEESRLREFCKMLPSDRLLTGNDVDVELFLREDRQKRQYTIPSTGAKLGYRQSLVVLATFVASLPHAAEDSLAAEYIVTGSQGGYVCEVILPECSPVRRAIGRQHTRKQVAKCAAAFEMCLELFKKRYLDDHLIPVFTKQLPAMRNARLAISSKKKGTYGMKPKPDLWSVLGVPEKWYGMALVLVKPEAMDRSSRPLVLLTRQPIPRPSPFPLFFEKGKSSCVQCIPISQPIEPSNDNLDALTKFTLRIFEDVFSKEYEATAADFPYLLAPSCVTHDFQFSAVEDVGSVLDWESLSYVQQTSQVPYTGNESDDFFQDKFVADPFSGARKFFIKGRRKDLKPCDSVPESSPKPSYWKKVPHDILNYSNARWTASRGNFVFRKDQPVVEAELISLRRNLLDDTFSDQDLQSNECFLILEPLRISPLHPEIVAMAYNFSVIIYRIESTMVAVEACNRLGLEVRPALALEALTKDSDNTDEHDREPLNFQAGMGNNYERLELLGDSFLKMTTTIALFTLIPDKAEFEYHVERMCLISNKNLLNNALDVKLEEYIRSKQFSRRTWYPSGLTLKKGKAPEVCTSHSLGDKSIADVCEAIIGAAYMTGYEEGDFTLAIQAVTVMVKSQNHPMRSWDEYYAAYEKPEWQTAPSTAAQRQLAQDIKESMGYQFRHPRLLRSAFQHPSYPSLYEKLPSYQRLEFLGDALLDMVAVDFLFQRHPDRDPQWLTEHKMAMVSNQFLGCLSVSLGFHRQMKAWSADVGRRVREYTTEIDQALEAARAEAEQAGQPADDFARDFWVHVGQPPKCLPDIVEAYVGAVFVDSGYDYGTVRGFFDAHVRPFFEDVTLYDTYASRHPVTLLTNLVQLRLHCTRASLLVSESRNGEFENMIAGGGIVGDNGVVVHCAFMIHDRVAFHGAAASGRYAKLATAKAALAVLTKMGLREFRDKYGCDCAYVEEDEAGDDGGIQG